MEKEDIFILAQLLNSMKDAVNKLDEAQKRNDMKRVAAAKQEILRFQEEIDKLL